MKKYILITGGAGFIGSHTYVALVNAGYTSVILDNLCNSNSLVLDRLKKITSTQPEFIQGDIRDTELLNKIFSEYAVQSVIHFAGLKAVGESVQKPLEYYDNNVAGTLSLLKAMKNNHIKTLVFSSSATVYGDPHSVPIHENFPRSATNPYGRSKLIIEEILEDLYHSDPSWKIARLRYFNPVGAHESGLIGEDPRDIPNNLMPYIAQVAVGQREYFNIFGNDYPTEDGTGVRDYVHVMDLAEGHVAALHYLHSHDNGLITVNLGTGQGTSVLQMAHAFEQASQKKIAYKFVERRPGDVATCWADTSLAEEVLGWKATRSIEKMCEDTWRWQHINPKGF